MKFQVTVTLPDNTEIKDDAEANEPGDVANAIRKVLEKARKQNPNASIFDCHIKLKSRSDA